MQILLYNFWDLFCLCTQYVMQLRYREQAGYFIANHYKNMARASGVACKKEHKRCPVQIIGTHYKLVAEKEKIEFWM